MTWIRVATLDSLESGACTDVEVAGKQLSLFRLGAAVYATQAHCPQDGSRLSDGQVIDDNVECMNSGSRYHIASGRVLSGPATEALKTYPTRAEGRDIFVQAGEVSADVERQWFRALEASAVSEGETVEVTVAGYPLLVYRLNGSFYTTSAICTHEFARLTDGWIEGETIECPLHQAVFHIPTGRVEEGPARTPLSCNPIEERDGDIWVSLPVVRMAKSTQGGSS